MQKIIRKDDSAGFRKLPFSRELYIEDFLEVAPAKFFRLSIGNEVRLKMHISSKQNLL
jgi:glutaminyl-tRNA synthetase